MAVDVGKAIAVAMAAEVIERYGVPKVVHSGSGSTMRSDLLGGRVGRAKHRGLLLPAAGRPDRFNQRPMVSALPRVLRGSAGIRLRPVDSFQITTTDAGVICSGGADFR